MINVKDWLFRSERADLERLKAEYEEKLAAVELHERSLDETAIVRQKLEGFDPKRIGTYDSIEEEAKRDDYLEAFLTEIHTIRGSEAFDYLINYLIRQQLLQTAMWADTPQQANFGRASINGISLMREEVERLDGIWIAQHTPPEEYDEHAAV